MSSELFVSLAIQSKARSLWCAQEQRVEAIFLCSLGHYRTLTLSPDVIKYCSTSLAKHDVIPDVLLAEPGDLVGIAEALRRLCDAKLRDEMRQRSLAADQKYFSWDAITEQCLRVLRALSGK